MTISLSHDHLKQAIANHAYYIRFQKTEITYFLRKLKHKIIGLFSGNQAGKTSSVANHYVERLLGIHPIDEKNKLMRKVRCMSSSLPTSKNPEEGDNTQYLELKKLIPPELIEKDISIRYFKMPRIQRRQEPRQFVLKRVNIYHSE